ncbi:MAG: periplasmic heavy metal sensor [Caulobacter sp.]|nr:periplasmic heavy metal sensor [Caulobacter sp.]
MKERGLLIALVISAAINLFLIGLGVGAWALGPRLGPTAPAAAAGGGRAALPLWAMGQALSPEQRPAFNAMLRKAMRAAASDVREARGIRRQAFDAVATDGFDPAQVNADLDRARALEQGARARIEHDVITFAASLPEDDRAALSAALRSAMMQRNGPRAAGPGGQRPDGRGLTQPAGPR